MKKIISLLFLFSLLLTACGPDVQQHPVEIQPELILDPTPTIEATLPASQSVITPQNTPLPSEAVAPLIDAPSIINIEMIDDRNGWGVTEQEIVRTDDGGVTWYNVTPSGLTETGYSVFTEFFDEKTAWLQFADNNNYPNGGTIYKTSDGGITWENFETPFSAGDLEFIDENNGWILADLGVGAGSMAVSVFQTTDGGETWNRVYTNDPNLDGAGDSLPLSGIKILLVPLDMQTAWIGGVVYSNGTVYLFRTDDAGKTWVNINKLTLPQKAQDSQVGIEKIQFISQTQGVLVLRMSSNNQETLIYSTNDGGDTWQAFSESIPESGLLEIPSADEIVFYSSSQFYITNDAGATFNIINPDIAFDESLTDMSFVNSSIGWVITTSPTNQRSLYKTEDGAQTWSVLIP